MLHSVFFTLNMPAPRDILRIIINPQQSSPANSVSHVQKSTMMCVIPQKDEQYSSLLI